MTSFILQSGENLRSLCAFSTHCWSREGLPWLSARMAKPGGGGCAGAVAQLAWRAGPVGGTSPLCPDFRLSPWFTVTGIWGACWRLTFNPLMQLTGHRSICQSPPFRCLGVLGAHCRRDSLRKTCPGDITSPCVTLPPALGGIPTVSWFTHGAPRPCHSAWGAEQGLS